MDTLASKPVTFTDHVEAAAHAVGHFALEVGESALRSGIQDPINAIDQLVTHAITKPLTGYELPTLHLIDAPKSEGTADTVAQTIGMMAGKIADMVAVGALLKKTGVMSSAANLADSASDLPFISNVIAPVEQSATLSKLAGAFGRGALMGGVMGFALQPAPEQTKNFWTYRAINALGYSASMAIGSTMGEGISLGLAHEGFDPAASPAKALGARTVKTVVRQMSNKVFNVRNEIKVLLHQDDQ